MNYLELVQRFCRECGETSVTTTVSQTGKARLMVDWVNTAYTDIVGSHRDWGFLRTATSFATVAAQATYTPTQAGTTNFGMWIKDSFRNYPTATGTDAEIEMDWIDHDSWRSQYQLGSSRTSYSQPYYFTITPAKSIGLGPVPSAGYTVTADYFKAPVALSGNTDAHLIPTHYEMIIIYRAMMFYGAKEAAGEVYQHGSSEYKKLLNSLMNDYLPDVEIAGPMI